MISKKFFIPLTSIVIILCIVSCASDDSTRKRSLSKNSEVGTGSSVDTDDEIMEFAVIPDYIAELPKSSFREVWAYVLEGREAALKADYPVTDMVYFNAEPDAYGHVIGVPARKKIASFKGRVHVSISCGSAGQTHFLLEEGSRARESFVAELIDMSRDFDGLNVDMEMVRVKDADNFLSFLRELRGKLPGKSLTVCVPARTKVSETYNYEKLAAICDKVFVMAYDEHWATSAPGPVASMNWCKSVAAYCLKTIGAEKLIMGIPFYGRAWADKSTARALASSVVDQIRGENVILRENRVNGIPTFQYDVTVKVTVYHEDELSLAARMEMYCAQGVDKVGFWRLGQETPGVWDLLGVE
jgi:spore germination protein YaaH